MRFVRLVAVLCLLTVWLTAKEHCALEALGVLPDSCAMECAEACASSDGCELVENAFYKQAIDHVCVAAPTLLRCLFVAPIPEETEARPVVRLPERTRCSLARLRTWQFIERAAPSARAPAFNA